MAVQKKKKVNRNKEFRNNSKVFKWTPSRIKAAKMLSTGIYTFEEIQDEIRIKTTTFWEWRQSPVFLEEVDKLTLELKEVTKAGLIRECLYGLDKKRKYISEDNKAHLDYIKVIADLQGLTKQKIELDANMNHSGSIDINKMTDEELQQAIDDDLKKLIDAGIIPNTKKDE